MRRLLIITLLGIFLGLSSARPAGGFNREITGVVTDSDSIPVDFANITAFANDSIVGGGITDSAGCFSIKVTSDCDKVRVSCIGYDDVVVFPGDSDPIVIILRQNSTTLKEIVVRAPLIQREADRILLNVAANPLSANKDAQELLSTAPGVWTTDDQLSIYGQSGTTVYIDDRKVNMSGHQLMTYLKSIRSASIATIEIIPKAGAEYSADSSGGVIRINLRRNRVDGLNGSTGMNLTAGEYKQWINPYVNLSMHTGRWTINLNGNVNGSPSDRYVTNEQAENPVISQKMFGMARHEERAIQGNMSFGIFYDPTDKDKLGLQFDWNLNSSRHSADSETMLSGTESATETIGNYDSKERFNNINISLNWSHLIDNAGSVLKLISTFNNQRSSMAEENMMGWSYLPYDSVYNTDSRYRYNIFSTDLSFRKVLNPYWNLNAGVKYTLNSISNSSFHKFCKEDTWIPSRTYDYDTSYDENIAAVYVTADGKAGRWKFKAGIRGEYSGGRGGMTVYDRFDIFPNVNIACNLTERGDYTLAVGYYRNIRRPSFQSLSPIVRQVSDYTYTVGNPGLTPSLTDALSLDLVLAGRFTIAAGYSDTRHPIRQMFASNPEYPERLYLTWDNRGNDRNIFIHADGSLTLTEWWNLYSSLTYVISSRKLYDDDPFRTVGYLQLVASTTVRLPLDFRFSVNCFYTTRMMIGNITIFPILNINPTLQKNFGRHWSVSIGVEDMLHRKNKIRTESSGYTRYSYTRSYPSMKIGVTYTFNSGKNFRTPRIERNMDTSRLIKE